MLRHAQHDIPNINFFRGQFLAVSCWPVEAFNIKLRLKTP